jgi:hypothetical protein
MITDNIIFFTNLFFGITSRSTLLCPLTCGMPRRTRTQASRSGTPLLVLLQFFLTHFIILIAVLETIPPDAGLQKRATFSTQNVGLAGTGNQTGPPAWQAEAQAAQPSTTPYMITYIKILPAANRLAFR